jgi:hypothetical protein
MFHKNSFLLQGSEIISLNLQCMEDLSLCKLCATIWSTQFALCFYVSGEHMQCFLEDLSLPVCVTIRSRQCLGCILSNGKVIDE